MDTQTNNLELQHLNLYYFLFYTKYKRFIYIFKLI